MLPGHWTDHVDGERRTDCGMKRCCKDSVRAEIRLGAISC